MNKNRLLLYLAISLFLGLIEFLNDLEDENILESLEFVPAVILYTMVLMTGIYYIRVLTIQNSKVKRYIENKGIIIPWIFYFVFICAQTFVFTIITSVLGYFFGLDGADVGVFSLFFWVIFTIIFSLVLIVYMIEIFLDKESQRREIEIKLSKIENERTRAKYLSLKNQLNPHFLFNSFNSLSALINIDTNKADQFLLELSNVYRYNLNHSEELVVSLEKELALIKSYMSLQTIRFKESIFIDYKIDTQKYSYLLPPMTLELLVENAIKHNIVEKKSPLYITITTTNDYVIVDNNYQPRTTSVNKEESHGIGLKNLKNQYKLIHNETPTFSITKEKYIAKIPLLTPNL
ncbi:sensor histidine kinase [Tenacibaculum agarivorans]|uniref:sensor histidine kinase n=1 Tax=Tenacibaculum agarivorans TaxID=1908389 RepID=UPI00094BA3C8|nr:histidine kinase [Tenacibaculum agarivorans]